jgi:calcineurin-like phosphoesterase family protein
MSQVYFISDLHLGHRNIHKFRKTAYKRRYGFGEFLVFESEEEHQEALIEAWNETIRKRDTVYILGDVAFNEKGLEAFKRLQGHKRIILGNHDIDGKALAPYCDSIGGFQRYKREFWLSHAPIHPDELRGKYNIHGHVHDQTLQDSRYFNVCPENIGMSPIPFETIKRIMNDRNSK